MVKEEKSRYIAFETVIEDETPVDVTSVFNSISRSILSLFGEVEASQSGIWLIEYDPEMHQGILRCTHKSLEKVQTAMAAVSRIDDRPIIIHLLKTSGTIRSLRSALKQ
ncbi:MAG: Rpp14/Pop5 family protein [Promethearchaeota archaeon]